MDYNLAGIDTVRFSVSESGFKKWLNINNLEKVKVTDTPLTSRLLMSKVDSGEFVRVVKFNDSYSNKLSNYLVITKSTSSDRHYIVDIAGLHQPTNGRLHKSTYQIIKALLEKYIIESVDLAFDFIAKNTEVVDGHNVARLLGSTVASEIYNTTYFKIGEVEGEDPLPSVWNRDSLMYHKSVKESAHHAGLNPLWYRLEFRIDGEAPFREPSVHRPKATNKEILESLIPYLKSTPIIYTVDTLASTYTSYDYLDNQLALFFDGRVLKHYT